MFQQDLRTDSNKRRRGGDAPFSNTTRNPGSASRLEDEFNFPGRHLTRAYYAQVFGKFYGFCVGWERNLDPWTRELASRSIHLHARTPDLLADLEFFSVDCSQLPLCSCPPSCTALPEAIRSLYVRGVIKGRLFFFSLHMKAANGGSNGPELRKVPVVMLSIFWAVLNEPPPGCRRITMIKKKMDKPVSILMVEDSPLDAELALAHLKSAGTDYSAKRVDNKQDFIQSLASDLPDLILADFSLPEFDGLLALELAKQESPDIPFLFVSGAMGEEVAVDMLKRGATDYILKAAPRTAWPSCAPSPL